MMKTSKEILYFILIINFINLLVLTNISKIIIDNELYFYCYIVEFIISVIVLIYITAKFLKTTQ